MYIYPVDIAEDLLKENERKNIINLLEGNSIRQLVSFNLR